MILQDPLTSLNPMFTISTQMVNAQRAHGQGPSGTRAAREAAIEMLLRDPQHPYTRKLLAAVPSRHRRTSRLSMIPGRVPSLADLPTGCTFADRCYAVQDACRPSEPELVPAHRQQARCLLEVRDEADAAGLGKPAQEPPAAAPASASTEVLLAVRDLHVQFGARRSWLNRSRAGLVDAVDGVELSLGRGEIVGLVGESGSGKTTLGKALLRLAPITAGQVDFEDVDLAKVSRRDWQQMRRRLQLLAPPETLDAAELESALRPVLWFVERAGNGGIPLTSAGYMRPAETEEASIVLPTMDGWIGKNNRESLAIPLLEFREALQKLKLLRKYKGKLLLTRAAAAAGTDPHALWSLLANSLIPQADGFERDATIVLLLHIATIPEGQDEPDDAVANTLTQLGWRQGEGSVSRYAFRDLSAAVVLRSLAPRSVSRHRDAVSAPARALAAAALAPGT